MESIYWVLTWACHRKCTHCYDIRFRPYVRDELDAVVKEGVEAYRKIIDNLPERLTFCDPGWPDDDGEPRERPGRVILAGGEVLVDPVRERLFYPALEALQRKYAANPIRVSVQTTGDLVTPGSIDDMLERGVWLIAISGMDDFHVGMEGDRKKPLMEKLRAMFAEAGVDEVRLSNTQRDYTREDGPFFLFFGANPQSWIGELWPRGRAWENGLSTATMATNFCARHSGAKHFLENGPHSEVAIEPNGDLYPCCLKTKLPYGNVAEEPLEEILESLRGHPVFEALNRGDPAQMGQTLGWDAARMEDASHTKDPLGRDYANLCIGCDKFHAEVLGPVIEKLKTQRQARRAARSKTSPAVAAS